MLIFWRFSNNKNAKKIILEAVDELEFITSFFKLYIALYGTHSPRNLVDNPKTQLLKRLKYTVVYSAVRCEDDMMMS